MNCEPTAASMGGAVVPAVTENEHRNGICFPRPMDGDDAMTSMNERNAR